MPADAANELYSIVEKYSVDYGEQYTKLFDLLADSLNASEDLLLFYQACILIMNDFVC